MIVQGGGGSYRPTSAHFAPLERVGSSHLGQRLAYPSEQWWERTTEWSLRERFGPALRVVRIRAPHLKQSALARWPVLGRMLPADLQREAVMLASLPSRLMMSRYYLLVVTALRAGERAHLAGTEGWDDGRLVPVEDVPTLLAPLTDGYDRASLGHDLAPRHLYRHRCNLQIHHPVRKHDAQGEDREPRFRQAASHSEGHGFPTRVVVRGVGRRAGYRPGRARRRGKRRRRPAEPPVPDSQERTHWRAVLQRRRGPHEPRGPHGGGGRGDQDRRAREPHLEPGGRPRRRFRRSSLLLLRDRQQASAARRARDKRAGRPEGARDPQQEPHPLRPREGHGARHDPTPRRTARPPVDLRPSPKTSYDPQAAGSHARTPAYESLGNVKCTMYNKLDKTCLLAYPVVSSRRLEQKEVGRLTQMVAHPPLEGLSSEEGTGSLLPDLFPEILGEVRERTTLDLYEVPIAEVEHVERETESYVAWVIVLGFVAYAIALYWAHRCNRRGGDPVIRFSLARGFGV